MTGTPSLTQKIGAEFLGSALLLATVVGSGIMAERLAGGSAALALLGNTLPTSAILIVLITMLGPISGAHLNPAVTLAFLLKRSLGTEEAAAYVAAQIAGALLGVFLAHAMFDLPLLQLSTKMHTGIGQGLSEGVATLGLIITILLTTKAHRAAVPTSVGLYIAAAYWFTASTSFANPAVTVARAFSNTFAGIRLSDVPIFLMAQVFGALCALWIVDFLTNGGIQAETAHSATTE